VREQEADELTSRTGHVGGEGMGTARHRHEACPRDAVCQPPAVVERQDSILVAVEDKRRRCNPGQPGTRVVSAGGRTLAVIRARVEPAGQPVGDVLADERRVVAVGPRGVEIRHRRPQPLLGG